MNGRIGDDQLDREIHDFLAWRAKDLRGAPTSVEMAERIASRVGVGGLSRGARPQLGWVLLAGLLIVASLGVMAAGASLLQPPAPLESSTSRVANGWIAYSTSKPQRGETDWASGADIYIVREGVEPRLIADRGGENMRNVCPTFSPDGGRLAYAVETSYGRELVVLGVDINGVITDPVRFQVPGSRWVTCPMWSSDGTRIAFIDTTDGTVTVRAPDGSPPIGGPAGLPGDPTLEDFTYESEPDGPILSPTGDRTVRLLDDCRIEVAALDGSGADVRAAEVCAYAIAGWSPDGRQVLVMGDGGQVFNIFAIEIDAPFRETRIATGALNGARAHPGWRDVSWQPVLR